MTKYQRMADRFRFLWSQPKIDLTEAREIVNCLPAIIAALDEADSLVRKVEELAKLRVDNARLRDGAFFASLTPEQQKAALEYRGEDC